MKNMATKQFVVTVLLIFALQGIILSYVYFSFYTSSVESIKNLGISNMKSQATVIFLTGNPDFALEGYDVFAAGYILKPLPEREGEFKRTVGRIFGKQKERLKELKVSVKGVSFSIPAGNIFLIDIDWRHRLVLHLENEDFILSQSYESLQKELMGDSRFLECHHRILVNMEKIALMEKDEFILSNGAKVPISQRRKRESKAKYMSFLARK